MLNIYLAQQNYHIGNLSYNLQKIKTAIEDAESKGVDLIVFSELCVTGYIPNDILLNNFFLEQTYKIIVEITKIKTNIGIIIGAPLENKNNGQKKIWNAGIFIFQNQIKKIIHKTLLPTYDVFDEARYFEPAKHWEIIEFKNHRIALTICEDIWNIDKNKQIYALQPMDELIKLKPTVMINISASPFNYIQENDRFNIIRKNVLKYNLPIIYCNGVGAHSALIFDGASVVMDKTATYFKKLSYFKEENLIVLLDENSNLKNIESYEIYTANHKSIIDIAKNPDYNIQHIYEALVLGVRDYFNKMNFKKAIIGSSGGIDSAVTIAIAVQALGNENVETVLMPSMFSSTSSVEDAQLLSKNLKINYTIVSIEKIYHSFLQALAPIFGNLPFSLAEENLQSRIRGNILMSIANKFGYILLNTSNKSELAMGYGTLYGDMAGGLSVLGDCYKLQVYALANYINNLSEIIPTNIIDKAPSAELRPNQKDSDSLPDYEILDAILYQWIEQHKTMEEIIKSGISADTVQFVIQGFSKQEFKRQQFCPILRVSTKAFGEGRKIPIVAKYG